MAKFYCFLCRYKGDEDEFFYVKTASWAERKVCIKCFDDIDADKNKNLWTGAKNRRVNYAGGNHP